MNTEILQRLEQAQSKSSLLSQWENKFIQSLQKQFNKRGSLSPRQIEIFERIEEQKLSTSAQDAQQQWEHNYNDKKRRIAWICAEYYQEAGYFNNLVINILSNPDFIPSEKEWRKMCENKYAKKVLAIQETPAKYETGSLVTFRATAYWADRQIAGDRPCVVIVSGGSIKSAAKGAKPYKVLPFGASSPIDCEERHLKIYRKKK
jgi:hypothetical protein